MINAGYRPTALQFVQDGNFFFNATRGGDIYSVTVTSAGKVYASTPLPKSQSSRPARPGHPLTLRGPAISLPPGPRGELVDAPDLKSVVPKGT